MVGKNEKLPIYGPEHLMMAHVEDFYGNAVILRHTESSGGYLYFSVPRGVISSKVKDPVEIGSFVEVRVPPQDPDHVCEVEGSNAFWPEPSFRHIVLPPLTPEQLDEAKKRAAEWYELFEE